jgi:hypothetical protein
MTEKTVEDSDHGAGCTGCSVGCGVIMVSLWLGQGIRFFNSAGALAVMLAAILAGLAAFYMAKDMKEEEMARKKREALPPVSRVPSRPVTSQQDVDQSVRLMCRASYFGGHKKYVDAADVTLVLTNDRILVKEVPGDPEVRIDIPYKKVTDFGLAEKEELSSGSMRMAGIFACVLKKQQQYLYIRYNDPLGLENNPVLGEFVDSHIGLVGLKLYLLLEIARGS